MEAQTKDLKALVVVGSVGLKFQILKFVSFLVDNYENLSKAFVCLNHIFSLLIALVENTARLVL